MILLKVILKVLIVFGLFNLALVAFSYALTRARNSQSTHDDYHYEE